MIPITATITLRRLNDKERSVPCYEVTDIAGKFPPMEILKNAEGKIRLYLNDTRGRVNAPDRTRADKWLMGRESFNFSSIYILTETTRTDYVFGCGTPNVSPTFGRTRKEFNPFYNYRNDGYVFVITPDYEQIKILVVQNGRYQIKQCAQQIAATYNDNKQ